MERTRLLASRSLDTDLLSREKQTLFRFSSLYILLSIIIISAFSFMYYELQRDLMLQEKKPVLEEYSKNCVDLNGEEEEREKQVQELLSTVQKFLNFVD